MNDTLPEGATIRRPGVLALSAKPDLEETLRRWEHFWRGELLDRPVIRMSVAREGIHPADLVPLRRERYDHAVHGRWRQMLSRVDRWLEQVAFPADTLPMVSPDFGPDQWAAFFGAEIHFSPEARSTNWVKPRVADWNEVLPLEFDPGNSTFQRLLQYVRLLAEHGEGRYLVETIDAHSNADALSALRGPQRFMMDLYDVPDRVARAMRDMRRSYRPIHDLLAEAGRMGGERGWCHNGFWSAQRYQVIQSDVICMLGQEHFRALVMPALEEEFAYNARAHFHLDGPGALRHLDDLLSIPGNWVMCYAAGVGHDPNWRRLDLLRRCQAAGKAVHAWGEGLDLAAVRMLMKELDPARLMISPDIHTETEARKLLDGIP